MTSSSGIELYEPSTNGAAPTGAPPSALIDAPVARPAPHGGPRAPHLEADVAIPEYPGYTCRVWVNFPQRLLLETQSGDQERIRRALSRIVLTHNGWCDEDGEPFPPAADAEFWTALPTHLAVCIIRAVQQRAMESPLAPGTRTR